MQDKSLGSHLHHFLYNISFKPFHVINLWPLSSLSLLCSPPSFIFILFPIFHLWGPGHIQENLEDELVQEALRKGLDLRQYSREIESELCKVEMHSVQDCI